MNFLARAVHDFRTPLTAVQGYCGLLLGGHFGALSATQRDVLDRTLHSVRRLTRLASALFSWSSRTGARLPSEIRDADIGECCRNALLELGSLALEKSISIDVDLQPPGQSLSFDPAQIEHLLVNLLENSCKFTPRGGYIQLRGFPALRPRSGGQAYRMEVSDNGMSISPENLQSIFQEHASYGGGSDRSGSGLGLAICRHIISGHGGEIFAESGNRGATFVFYLPFAKPAAARAALHLVPETVAMEKAKA
jgi:signal transduction histidine kinase